MRCAYETPESHPGACDGGFQCEKTAVSTCDECGADFCPKHLKACLDCSAVLCFAPMEGRCHGEHVCKKLPEGEKSFIEQQLERELA